ncbi:hypothetical protein BDV23DRAFT_146507 [Aspergillus alliaceus]|uniref:Uncharacterized protein n=1 Tax=Petromyces alliaceus TaxID=209559 RepID=A0A5N7CKV9_PETAA|nr:uncharacterized protein BDW43DRAFT_279037 [Aspergillus alliaceus]KAB8232608.1 hypothetical protein BDW43DRAFT_279037 [Aspergillus alliaceus]KAE8394861.1 hypothetical protein BDV23DRAFT_146507 [Aspergillus alliaceus]
MSSEFLESQGQDHKPTALIKHPKQGAVKTVWPAVRKVLHSIGDRYWVESGFEGR